MEKYLVKWIVVKVKLSLINSAPCHKDIWGRGSIASLFFTLGLGYEWPASCPEHFTPWGMRPSTHWIGGWVGSRAGLGTVEKKKISCPCWELNPSP
jgi:hypothetical protein